MMHKKIIGYKAIDITRNVIQAQMELDRTVWTLHQIPINQNAETLLYKYSWMESKEIEIVMELEEYMCYDDVYVRELGN